MISLRRHTHTHEPLSTDRNLKLKTASRRATSAVAQHRARRLALALSVLATAAFLLLAAGSVSAQVLTTLHSFTGGSDGWGPTSGLVQGDDGNFYGTTGGTETGTGNNPGNGTVFKITTDGVLTTIYSFTGGTDGECPFAGLVLGSDGNFYGTTYGEGGGPSDEGTVYKITPGGELTTLHSFSGSDGCLPLAGLVQGSDGNFYGTTAYGGASFSGTDNSGYGTVFQITPGGTLTTLHSFTNADGSNPNGELVQGSDGNFYGTTESGGASGEGTVFQITPSSTLTTLHSFSGSDGGSPADGLVQGPDGNFYGTTVRGGASYVSVTDLGYGTVFKITPDGALTTLHSFTGQDGAGPISSLLLGSDGNFYGITFGGGDSFGGTVQSGYGTVFKVTPGGVLTILHSFLGTDGSGIYDHGGLAQGSGGNFYGTTSTGGTSGNGTVFEVSPALLSLTLSPAKLTGGASSAATVTLGVPAPTGGFVVEIKSLEPTVATVPSDTIVVPAGSTSATFDVHSVAVGATSTATISAGANGVTKTGTLTVEPPVVKSLALAPTAVTGGKTSVGTVTIEAINAVNTTVTLSSSNPAATVPTSVIVRAGKTTATFTISTTPVAANTTATLKAACGGASATAKLTVDAPALSALTVTPATVVGGKTSVGTVTLSGAAAAPVRVTLSSNGKAATVPTSVTVLAGRSTATFTIDTTAVIANTVATIKASGGAASTTAKLTVDAPEVSALSLKPTTVIGGKTSVGTVTLSGAAAARVTVTLSSNSKAATVPISVTVLAGRSTATFTIDTTKVTKATVATIKATGGGTSTSANLTIEP